MGQLIRTQNAVQWDGAQLIIRDMAEGFRRRLYSLG